MKVIRVFASAAIVAGAVLGIAQAKSLEDMTGPAEYPPSSFTGRQYVDSQGCVFIRAGVEGAVTWVPRVTRGRQVVCGFQPSLPKARAVAEAPAAAPAPTVTTTAPASAPAPRTVSSAPTTSTPTVVKQRGAPSYLSMNPNTPRAVASAARVAPAPTLSANPVVTAPKPVVAKPVAVPVKTVQTSRTVAAPTGASACANLTGVSAQYMRGSGVRCGPQSQSYLGSNAAAMVQIPTMAVTPRATTPTYSYSTSAPVAVAPAPQPVQRSYVSNYRAPQATGGTRVAPRHVYEAQQNAQRGIAIPHGYKPAWEDDRLNTKRAHQTFSGKARMDLAWTQTVPRELINRATGQVVTASYPGLYYPHLSYAEQRHAQLAGTDYVGGYVSSRGTAEVVSGNATPMYSAPAPKPQRQVVSTRSYAPTAAPKAAATSRYMQVGAFSSDAQARAAAQRLAARGVPTRLGTATRGGVSHRIVLIGPFDTQARLQAGLSAARGAGLTQAIAR